MSMRTKNPATSARSRILRKLSTAVALSTSSPSCVSFSEMNRSIPEAIIASITSRYSRVATVAESRLVTLSPRRSSVRCRPCARARARRLDRFLDGLAGDEAAREARRPAHAVARGHLSSERRFVPGDERRSSRRDRSSQRSVSQKVTDGTPLVRPAGRDEQVLDRACVVAQHDTFAHAEPAALGDHDAARLQRLGGFFDRLAAAGHAEVGARRAASSSSR